MGLKVVQTKFLADATIVNPDIFSGVICLESAARIHGMSLYPTTPLKIYCDTMEGFMGYITLVRPNHSYSEGVVHIGKNLYVTSQERTVCDLVAFNGNEEFIYQALQMYLAKFGAAEDLLGAAQKFGCEAQMRQRIETLQDYLSDMAY